MLGQVGAILPLALGIAISPVPIIATLLLLMSPKAKGASAGFALDWVAGVVVAVSVFALLTDLVPAASSPALGLLDGMVKVLLGLGLLWLAWRQWRARPAPGKDPELPSWMAAIDSISTGRALGLAFLLAALNPKNLMLAAAAGVILGQGDQVLLAGVTYVLVASSTVAGMVLARVIAGDRLSAWLQSVRGWLVHNNSTVMAVLLLILGAVVLGRGLAAW